MGERKLGEKREREKERRRREKLQYFLSRFPGDWTFGSGRSKRQSWSTHRKLRVGTKISDLRQAPRGRGFSPTRLNSCLRVIQMVEVFGAGKAVQFSPKDLRLDAGFFRLFSNSPGLNLWYCFG